MREATSKVKKNWRHFETRKLRVDTLTYQWVSQYVWSGDTGDTSERIEGDEKVRKDMEN